jgi:hypothetical protein
MRRLNPGHLNLDQRPLDTSRICTLLALLILLPTSGCMHRPGTAVETYHLQDAASYPLLVPSRASSPSGTDMTTTPVDLGRLAVDLPSHADSSCSIEGPVFSLHPPDKPGSTSWVVKSPGVRGWETQGGQIDAVAEWTQFTQKLQSLQRNGCFASGSTLTNNLRTIAESIPIPGSELLLFYYSYSGIGAVDLVPGMQIRVERGVLQGREGDQTMKSIEAQYEVIPGSSSGVALRLSQTSNRHLLRKAGEEDKTMFDLVSLTQTATMLRLFLQARTDKGVERKPILLLSNSTEGLDQATRQVDSSASNGCAAVSVDGTTCISFTKSAVSLMISCRINGKLSYKALGTTVSQAIKDSQPALNSLVLTRRMTNGGYAAFVFPRSLEAANQMMLVNGDSLSW